MELVVRTPYGDADVDLVAHAPTTRVLELVQEVTGQAAPPVVTVDGRTIPSDTAVADAGLVVGSVVETAPASERPVDSPRVRLVQLTDHGTGVARDLGDGRYRVGPGRRLHARELDRAPVEHTTFELDVSGDGVRVAAAESDGPLRLGGSVVRLPRPWREELLDTGRRVFALQPPTEVLAATLPAGPDGTVAYHRPPLGPRETGPSEGPAFTERSHLAVAAVEAARARPPRVWSRRAADPDAFTVTVGLDHQLAPVTLDLRAEARPAIVGSERFRAALARALLVEAVTAHGPADLRVLVATTTERAPDWEWAKWLPHLRTEGEVAVATSGAEVAAWSDRFAVDPRSNERLSLVVVDEVHWWRSRDAPLRALWASPSTSVCVIVLSDDTSAVPGNSSAIVVLEPTGDVTLHRTGGRARVDGAETRGGPGGTAIRPPLVSPELAEDVARHLAPLDDAELAEPVGPVTLHRPGLPDAIGDAADPSWAGDRARRWAERRSLDAHDASTRICLGRGVGPVDAPGADDGLVHVDLTTGHHVLVTARSAVDAVDAVTTLVVGAAVDTPPDLWSFVRFGHGTLSGLTHLDRLPHAAGRWNDASPLGVDRVIRRITHAVRTTGRGTFTAVVEDLPSLASEMPLLLEALLELATSGHRLQLLAIALGPPDLPAAVRDACRTHIDVTSVGALPLGHADVEAEPGVAYVPLAPLARAAGSDALLVGAAVRARPPSSLERRLLRRRRDARGTDPTSPFVVTADALTALADEPTTDGPGDPGDPGDVRSGRARRLVPPGLPAEEDAEALLERWPGDAVPLGSIDRPEADEPEPYWWLPLESGSLLTIGSRRSAHDHLLSTLVVGIAARFSADDLHVYAIGAGGPRPRAIADLPHTGGIADPADSAAVEALVALVEAEAERRRAPGRREHLPDVVVIVDDVGTLRRPLGELPVVDRLAELAANSRRTGIHVVASAVRAEDCRPLVHACDELLVGALADPEDARRLALPDAAVVDARGRCWSRRADRIVQLARPPVDLERAVRRRAPEPPTSRPPGRLDP